MILEGRKIKIVIARVDERLIHGQIVNEWICRIHPTHLIIIDYGLRDDMFMANIYKAMAPFWVEVEILSPEDAVRFLRINEDEKGEIFLLARTPSIYVEILEKGYALQEIVLAEKKYFPKKRNVTLEHKRAINRLLEAGVRITVQLLLNDEPYEVRPYAIEEKQSE